MAFRFLEKIALADAAFEITGKNVTELFQSGADALIELTANPKTVKPKIKKEIKLENENVEQLFFDFLQELVFLKDAEGVVFHDAKVIVEKNKVYKLKATVTADRADPKKQELHNDVKAVTMHKFKVEQTKKGWKAFVIADI